MPKPPKLYETIILPFKRFGKYKPQKPGIKQLKEGYRQMQEKKYEVRELNLITNRGGSGSVGFKLSIPKSWAQGLGLDLENKTVVASYDGDRITVSAKKKAGC